jgi:lysophospholipase L1-like esterase
VRVNELRAVRYERDASVIVPAGRGRLISAVLLALLAIVHLWPSSAAAADCRFQLGFDALRRQIPALVGDCLDQERYNPLNGNAEQRTAGGLLVWRKADNWTAFTDGATTWIAGPQGLASRPNRGPLFPWETITASALLPPAPMPLISRDVPAHAENDALATHANDGDYATQWRSGRLPAWLVYDLTTVPRERRGEVLLAWYANETNAYEPRLVDSRPRNLPASYTIEANRAAGGGRVPTDGWVELVAVAGNVYHSRQHLLNLSGYNWVGLRVAASVAPGGQEEVRLNLDLHDAGQGTQDSWIFYGDSITAGGMSLEPEGPVGTFGQLVNALLPSHFPSQEGGGIGGLRSADGARLIDSWLAVFPGRFVGLSYGTNDARGPASAEEFYANYQTMVQAVIKAGKIPLVPKIPWARTTYIQEQGPILNAVIEQLYADYPEIVRGPDFWQYFKENQHLLSRDDLHPTAAGYAAYRQLWAETAVQRVYLHK